MKISFCVLLLSVLFFIPSFSNKETKEVFENYCSENIEYFKDSRDNKSYGIIKIGNQTWFAENLNYTTGKSWCYNDDETNCKIYGRLYGWETAMTACPDGWRLPSNEDWEELIQYLGGYDVAGFKLKKDGTIESGNGLWEGPGLWGKANAEGTNEVCFSALPGGYKIQGLGYTTINTQGNWWSSSEENIENEATFYSLSRSHGKISRFTNYRNKSNGMSCRCIKN